MWSGPVAAWVAAVYVAACRPPPVGVVGRETGPLPSTPNPPSSRGRVCAPRRDPAVAALQAGRVPVPAPRAALLPRPAPHRRRVAGVRRRSFAAAARGCACSPAAAGLAACARLRGSLGSLGRRGGGGAGFPSRRVEPPRVSELGLRTPRGCVHALPSAVGGGGLASAAVVCRVRSDPPFSSRRAGALAGSAGGGRGGRRCAACGVAAGGRARVVRVWRRRRLSLPSRAPRRWSAAAAAAASCPPASRRSPRLSPLYLVDPASSICLSQRLSHACLSTHGRYSETANGSLNQLWFLWSLAPLLLG